MQVLDSEQGLQPQTHLVSGAAEVQSEVWSEVQFCSDPVRRWWGQDAGGGRLAELGSSVGALLGLVLVLVLV